MKEDLLFHYTSLGSLIKILTSEKLRASCFAKMNDPSESEPSNRIGVSGEFPDDTEGRKKHFEQSDRFRSTMNRVRRSAPLACFSVDRIEESGFVRKGFAIPQMWAHYGENHRGVCLVFQKSLLIDAARKHASVVDAKAVTYDTNLVSGSHLSVELDLARSLDDDKFENECLNAATQHIWFNKDSGWFYEQEFRIVFPLIANDYIEIPCIEALGGVVVGSKFPHLGHQHLNKIREKLGAVPNSVTSIFWDRGVGVARIPIAL